MLNEDGESYQLYTLSGAPREAFEKFGMPRNTAVFDPTFRGESVVRSADIRRDPRYGKSAPHYGMPRGHLPVVSYLAVPVRSANGTVHGGLFFGHEQPEVFSEDTEALVRHRGASRRCNEQCQSASCRQKGNRGAPQRRSGARVVAERD